MTNIYRNSSSPFGYDVGEEDRIDAYGVDHSNFSLRDEIEYQMARVNREDQFKQSYNKQGITENYPQFGKSFWGNNSENNYGFGSSNISENIEQMKTNGMPTLEETLQYQNQMNNQDSMTTPTPWGQSNTTTPTVYGQNSMTTPTPWGQSNPTTPTVYGQNTTPTGFGNNAQQPANYATISPVTKEIFSITYKPLQKFTSKPFVSSKAYQIYDVDKGLAEDTNYPSSPLLNKYNNLIEQHFNDMKGIEKRIPFVYLDSMYNKTTGRGHNINKYDTFNSVNFTVGENGRSATEEEKQRCFKALNDWTNTNKSLEKKQNYNADFFKREFANDCNLRISPEEEKILYLEHVNKELPRIPHLVPNFNKLSDNKKLLIMDMVYNLGYDGFKKNFPNFIEGAKANSTKEMLKHYHRSNVGFDRNYWARKLLEEDSKNNR